MKFTIGQRVRIKDHAFEFGGAVGTIENPPDGIHDIDPDLWLGPCKYERRRHGQVLVYWVQFDEPTDDGSGDGPYRGGLIAEEDLQPISRGS